MMFTNEMIISDGQPPPVANVFYGGRQERWKNRGGGGVQKNLCANPEKGNVCSGQFRENICPPRYTYSQINK